MTSFFDRLRSKSRQLRTEVRALYLAYRDRRVPWYSKILVLAVVGYAFSPIDLIPDFIPVIGHLDDLILVPLGVALAIRWIPPEVMAEARSKAASSMDDPIPASRLAGIVIVAIWLILAWLGIALIIN